MGSQFDRIITILATLQLILNSPENEHATCVSITAHTSDLQPTLVDYPKERWSATPPMCVGAALI
jgi:hypothetical protein